MARIDGTNLADILNGTSVADQIFGNGGNDRLAGHGGNDTIRGGSGQDIIDGNAGNDILFADSNEGGEDVLFGGDDSDILVSGSGRDHFNGGSGGNNVDAASWQESAFAVVANISTGTAASRGVQDTFTLIENLIGSRHGDVLTGDEGKNGLFGGDGDDRLFGQGGSDELSGGAGNDTLDGGAGPVNSLRGGAGVDTVDYFGVTGLQVDLEEGTVHANDRFERLAEIEVVKGSNSADQIVGDAFGNQLFGRAGNDMIDGGEGNDVLSGGDGADLFDFDAFTPSKFRPATDSGFDRITDFERAEGDVIDLRSHKEATTFADLRANASQFGTDTHLRLGDDTIVVEDVSLSELTESMFIF